MNEEKEKLLKEIKIEDYIWVLYLDIIFLSWYSNDLERDYLINDNKKSKKEYEDIMVFIFIILVLVYTYFFKGSFDSYTNLKEEDDPKKKELITLSLVASFLLLVSGLIYLYVAVNNENFDVELAFN